MQTVRADCLSAHHVLHMKWAKRHENELKFDALSQRGGMELQGNWSVTKQECVDLSDGCKSHCVKNVVNVTREVFLAC